MGFIKKTFKRLSKFWLYWYYCVCAPAIRREVDFKIMGIDDTLDEVFRKRKTLIRFGDGELRLLMKVGDTGFQQRNDRLEIRLKEILCCGENEGMLLCLPGSLGARGTKYKLLKPANFFWNEFTYKYEKELKLCGEKLSEMEFGDAFVSRPYIDIQNFEFANQVFSRVKRELKGKDVLIVEGRLSRFGVGDDLLCEAKRVRRILGPEVNAFEQYGKILERASREELVDVVILSLGPTAKLLAYDLTKLGFWCLDLGHLDIEYEWYRMKAQKKVSINNKYVNEVKDKFISVGDLDLNYEKEIIYEC